MQYDLRILSRGHLPYIFQMIPFCQSNSFLTESDFAACPEISEKSTVSELKGYKKRKMSEKNGFFG